MRKKRYKTLSVVLLLVLIGVRIPVPTMATNTKKDTSIDAVLKEVEVVSNPVSLGSKIRFRDINKSQKVNSENKLFLVNLTGGYVQAAANVNEVLYPAELSELMTVYVVLKNSNLTDTVKISKEAANSKSENLVTFGFKEGDEVSIQNLLNCYLLTRSDDARIALVEYISKNESDFVKLMNKEMEKLSPMMTNFVSSDGIYNENQYSLVHDLYLLMYELLQNNWFVNTMGKEKIEIEYSTKDGEVLRKTCIDSNISKFGKVKVPATYSLVAQFTSSNDLAKGNQIVIVKDGKDNYYLSILAQVDLRKDISEESAKLLRELIGEAYEDEIIPVVTPTPTPSPSPTPSPTPTKVPLGIPTQSNNARYQYIMGTNYKEYTINNLPKGFTSAKEAEKQMTTITVPVWKMTSNGGRTASTMKLTVHKKLADSVSKIFKEIYALDIKFPIKKLVGYQYRKVGGVGLSNSTLMSIHTFGAAIDINPGDYDNDYYLGKGNDLRDKSNPYCIPDEVIQIFENNGWFWGGNFSICADTMHFQYLGLDFLTYQGKSPFRELKVKNGSLMEGKDVKNLQQRLKELGFKVTINGVYDKTTESAIKKAQKQYGLGVTGVVDYKTWETIINLTHYMSYVF